MNGGGKEILVRAQHSVACSYRVEKATRYGRAMIDTQNTILASCAHDTLSAKYLQKD